MRVIIDFIKWIFLLLRRGLALVWLASTVGLKDTSRGFGRWVMSPDGAALLSFLGLILLAITLLIGNSWQSSNAKTVPSLRDEAQLNLAGDDPIVARIGESQLRLSDVREFAIQAGKLQPSDSLTAADAFDRKLVDEAINNRLIVDAAIASNIALQPDVRAKLQVARGRVLASAWLEKTVAQEVTDATVKSFYERQRKTLSFGSECRFERLSVAEQAAADQLLKNIELGMTLKEASFTVPQNVAYDDNFEFIASKESDPTFSEACQTGSTDKLVGPFQTSDGWVIVKLLSRKSLTPPSYSSVKDTIREYLVLNTIEKRLEEMRSNRVIKTYPIEQEIVNHSDGETSPDNTQDDDDTGN